VPEATWDIDPRYLPAADNEALRLVFRAHRVATPEARLRAIAEPPAAICATRTDVASAEPIPVQTTWDVGREIICRHGISTAAMSEVGISDRALRKRVSAGLADARMLWLPAEAWC
jgi:hypothetical protein